MDIDFIVRYLADEISNEEKEHIEQWINASSINQHRIEQFRKIWETSSFLCKFENIDEQEDWELIRNKLRPKYRLHAQRIPVWKYIIRATAIVILAIGLTYGLFKLTYTFQNTDTIIANTTNQTKPVLLPDGTEVTLNKNSLLSCNRKFNIKNRTVKLGGEAFFNVCNNSIYPFIIQTNISTIQVIGTIFNVREDTTSVKVTVLSGKVWFYETENKSNRVEISKDETASFYLTSKQIIYSSIKDLNFLAWKTGKFEFMKTPTTDALNTIADYFDKQLIIQTNILDSITGVFDNQPLNEILREIELTTSLKIDNIQNYIIIRK